MFFESFFKGPEVSLCILHHIQGPHIGISRWPHFCFPWGACPLGRPVGFNDAVTFKVGLYAIPTADLDAFTWTLGLGYDFMTFCFDFIGIGWTPVVPWLLATLLTSLVGLVSLFSTLSKAHLGYLQCVSALLRCFISFWRSSCLLQAVFALWVRVLIALYLAERLW